MSDNQGPAAESTGDEHASDAFLVRRQLHGTGPVGKYRELIVGRPGLGAGVEVLDDVRIGSDTVLGAGAVVTDDLPSRSVAAGTPARVIRER